MGNNAQTKNKMAAKPSYNANLRWGKWFAGIVFVVAIVLGLRALAMMSDANTIVYRLAAMGWGKFAEIIVQNKISALWHAAFMTVCAGVFIWLFYGNLVPRSAIALPPSRSPLRWAKEGRNGESAKPGRIRNQYVQNAAKWLMVAIVAADAFFLSRHYVKAMPLKAFDENDVIRVLKSDQTQHRVALVTQDGFYNLWLTYLFPYHGIKTINVTQMPRMPADYKRFFEAVGQNPLRLWQLSAVGFVLAPAQVWGQFQNDPAMKGAFELVYAYNVKPLLWPCHGLGKPGKPADAGVEVIPATAEQPGQHVIMRLLKPASRFTLIGKWEVVNDAEALRRLGSADYCLFEKALIAPGCAENLPGSAGSTDGQVQVLACRPGKIRLRTSSTSPAILRAADKYDPDWKAWIDGKKTNMMRTDFIFQGVYVESGMHEVIIEYAPSKWPLAVQAVGFMAFAGAVVMLIVRRRQTNMS